MSDVRDLARSARAIAAAPDYDEQAIKDALWAVVDAVLAANPKELRVTWHDHEPKPGEGRKDLRLLLNRGDWSVPWVRREVAALFEDYEALIEGGYDRG